MTYHDVKNALYAAGLDVWYPAAKQGVCLTPYVVVQNMGTFPYAQSSRLMYTLLSIHCYVPLGNYDGLKILVGRVRDALAPLMPDLRPVGNESVHTVNDTFRAHETYLEYIVQKKA